MTAPSREAPRTLDADQVTALEEEREFLLGSLRDLERERESGDIDEGDYQTLRDDYTARAAAVLHALNEARAAESDQPTGPGDGDPDSPGNVAPGARSPGHRPAGRSRRVVIGITIVLVLVVGAGLGVATFSDERLGNENVSGRGMSETARHVVKAQELERDGKAAEALKEYDAAIAADPANVVALTYRGWLLGRAGFADRAMASVEQALAINPDYPDAHFFRGMLLYQGRKDPAAAVAEFETYLASNPPPSAAAAVQGVLEKARQDAAAAPAVPAPAPAPVEPTPDTSVPG